MDLAKMRRRARSLRITINVFLVIFAVWIAFCAFCIAMYAMVVLPEGIRYTDYDFMGIIIVHNEYMISDIGVLATQILPRFKTIGYLVLGIIALVFLKRIVMAAEAGRPFDVSVGRNIRCLAFVCLALWIFACVWSVFWTQYAFSIEASGAANGMTQFIESGQITGDPVIYEVDIPPDPPSANLPLLFASLTLFLLSYIFTYGIELQRLSDETV